MLTATFATAVAAPSIVVEVATGKVVSQYQAFDRWYPASLTKLMTVYTVFEEIKKGKISLNSPVKVSSHALAEPPSKMGFPVGTVMTVETAIKILMVKSANDIATATAESVGGSESAFVAMMNANAARLGMKDSHYVNAHGLQEDQQYTSARDLAVLTLAIKKEFPQYSKYFSIQAIKAGRRRLTNHNPLLFRFDGTNGMKTGFTCNSGLNIVVSARRGGRELIAVVLGGETGQERNVRAAKLLSEGFAKNVFFSNTKIDNLKPVGAVHRFPVNMREAVCSRKKKKKMVTASAGASIFAMKQPSLDDLEDKYLKKKVVISRVERISLGHATGPDPYGLLGGKAKADVTSYAEEASDGKWPVVFGTKRVKVPVPEPRPQR
ncbi:MAG: D-alanyl-D-alanine carboxypeptidase [Salaquimonas sp.]|nr:D-alanyl-D-alanine carboxypeptidase [Salaquimonas sp.]